MFSFDSYASIQLWFSHAFIYDKSLVSGCSNLYWKHEVLILGWEKGRLIELVWYVWACVLSIQFSFSFSNMKRYFFRFSHWWNVWLPETQLKKYQFVCFPCVNVERTEWEFEFYCSSHTHRHRQSSRPVFIAIWEDKNEKNSFNCFYYCWIAYFT